MEIKLIICFSCVITTINFQELKILLVYSCSLINYKQFVKLLMVNYIYLLNPYPSDSALWQMWNILLVNISYLCWQKQLREAS